MNIDHSIQLKDVSLMPEICVNCYEDYTTHSFNRIAHSLDAGHIFYTKISNASKYNDTDGIQKHCTNYLNYINPDKWTWIIDFKGFGLKHTLGLNTGIQLSYLINKFGRLNHIIIINTNIFVEKMLKMIKLTLNKEYHKSIVVLHRNNKFIETIEKWTYADNEQTNIIKNILNNMST